MATLPTISRYERVRDVIRNEPALCSRLSQDVTLVVVPGSDDQVKFETEVVKTTLALHESGKDVLKANANDILKEAIRHVDMSAVPSVKPARAATNGAPKEPRKLKMVARPKSAPKAKTKARAKAAAPAPAPEPPTPPSAKKTRPGKAQEQEDEANVYIAVFSNLAYAYKTLERWDRKPGAKERLSRLGAIVQEVRELSK